MEKGEPVGGGALALFTLYIYQMETNAKKKLQQNKKK
jgi:hypothetical protein